MAHGGRERFVIYKNRDSRFRVGVTGRERKHTDIHTFIHILCQGKTHTGGPVLLRLKP